MALYAIGIGIDSQQHITEQARQAIRACRTLFVLTPDAACIDQVVAINPVAKITDCFSYYRGKLNRPAAYEAIARSIIRSCSPYTNTGLITYGHPMFLVSAVERLIQKAEAASIRVVVVPAISSFDTILADLKVDMAYGLQIYDATLLVSDCPTLNVDAHLLVFQVANIGSDLIEPNDIDRQRLSRLKQLLLKAYPGSHMCRFVLSRRSILDQPEIVDVSLDLLDTDSGVVLRHRPTLYVPPVS